MLRPVLLQLDVDDEPDDRSRPPRRPGDAEAEASGAAGDDPSTTSAQPRPNGGSLMR